MSSRREEMKMGKYASSGTDFYRTVKLPAQEVKKTLAQLKAAAVPEEGQHGDGEGFEDKIERAMRKIVSDTVGSDTAINLSPAKQAPRAKTAGSVKVARAKGIRLKVNPEGTEKREARPPKAQKEKREHKKQIEPILPQASQEGTANDERQDYREYRQEAERVHEEPTKKSRRGLVAAVVIIAVLFVGTVGVYAGVGNYYQDKFLPGTNINHIDCSGKTVEETEQLIRKSVEDYSLTVYARDTEPQVITAGDIDYKYQPYGGVQEVMEQQQPMKWLHSYFNSRTYTVGESITYEKEKVREQVNQLDCMQADRQTVPVDAHLQYANGEFSIVPETEGTALDAEKALEFICSAIDEAKESVDLEEGDVYVKAAVTADSPELAQQLENANKYAKASITYTFGDDTEILNGETIQNWITTDADGSGVDEESLENNVYAYVEDLASRHDTVGTVRSFTTSSGSVISAGGGNYGWQIDQDAEAAQLLEEIQSGQEVTREPIYSSTALLPGPDDIGNTYIEVDLTDQYMYFYRDGNVIFESDIVSGDPDDEEKATPTGVYHMYYKKLDEVLRGEKDENGEYEYETPVKYWMPFNGGIGFHDADWQYSYGGDVYTYSGSHGCINLPVDKAAELYEIIDTETPIIVYG